MENLSKKSLSEVLNPAVDVLAAYKKSTSWNAIKSAWKDSRSLDKIIFSTSSIIFGVTAFISIGFNSSIAFMVSVISAMVSVLYLRIKIIDVAPEREEYDNLDRHFMLNYRFRRYLEFRGILQSKDIGLNEIEKARLKIKTEYLLEESRQPSLNFLDGAIVSVLSGVFISIATRDYLIKSGVTLLIITLLLCFFIYTI